MLTPNELDRLPDKVITLYRALETQFLEELADNMKLRLKYRKPLDEVLIKQNTNVRKEILKNRNKVKKAIQEMLRLALKLNLKNDIKLTKSPLLTAVKAQQLGITNAALRTGQQNLLGELIAIDRELPMDCRNTLISVLREVTARAELKVYSGHATYEESIRDGIAQLAKRGIELRKKNGVREALDVVVRRCVLTGINAAAGAASMRNAVLLGFDFVEVTAHVGARNKGVGYVNHESWQGKIYHVSDKTEALRLAQLARPVGY